MSWLSSAGSAATDGASAATNAVGGAAGTTGSLAGSMADLGGSVGQAGQGATSVFGAVQNSPSGFSLGPVTDAAANNYASYGTPTPGMWDYIGKGLGDMKAGSDQNLYEGTKNIFDNPTKSAAFLLGNMIKYAPPIRYTPPPPAQGAYTRAEDEYLKKSLFKKYLG
jgi:hypothetical protein